MPINPLDQSAKKGIVYRNIPIRKLPGEIRAELRLLDYDRSREKFRTIPPSRALIVSLFIATFLFLFAAVLPMKHLLHPVRGSGKWLFLVLFLLFFLVGFFLLVFFVKIVMKRVNNARFYLYLTDSYLLERFPGRISFFPRKKVIYAFERRRMASSRNGADLYFDTVVYREEGVEQLYDLQDHYYHRPDDKNKSHDNLYRVIRKRFGVGGPPPQSAFLQQFY